MLTRLSYLCSSQHELDCSAVSGLLFFGVTRGAISLNSSRLLSGAIALLLIASCAAPGNSNRDSIPVEESAVVEGAAPSTSGLITAGKAPSGSAVNSLLNSAEAAYADNSYESSAAFAERAIRISPRSPRAYFMLAQIRFAQAQVELSQALLKKAQSLAQDQELRRAIVTFMQKTRLNR